MSGHAWFGAPVPAHGARPRPYAHVPDPSAEELLREVKVVSVCRELSTEQKLARIREALGGAR